MYGSHVGVVDVAAAKLIAPRVPPWESHHMGLCLTHKRALKEHRRELATPYTVSPSRGGISAILEKKRMRDELMTEALCWELETKITAEYAHAARATGDFAFYCPHEICLAKVHAQTKRNTYFCASKRHAPGCPNETRSTEPSLHPGAPKPRPAQVQRAPIPNLLGPQPRLKPKSRAPTQAELLQLSRAVRETPALHPGTLQEVVDAWMQMPSKERGLHALTIGHHKLTYDSAFTFTRDLKRPCHITSLQPDARVIFGLASVRVWAHLVLIESSKKFSVDSTEVPLRLPVNLAEAPSWLTDLVDQRVTLFWHGKSPELSAKKNGFGFKVDLDSPYAGIALRLGELTP
ncbi:hypothetical protein R8510_03940 [Ralstonia chuxiongensis]|nr:hypothetical protein R8510_03940 [Ralstonia chuxiongensis]